MAFEKKTWKNRQSEHPNRRTLTPTEEENVYDVERSEGLVMEEGDAFDQENMNDLEKRIEEGFVSDGISAYTHSKDGTVHALIGKGDNIRFLATADFAAGDTFTVNGAPCTAKTLGGDSLWAGFFKIGAMVVCWKSEGGLTFNGGGLPAAELAKLVPANLKTGVSITANGKTVNGTFTADGTAAAGDMLVGKIGYVKGQRVTGTMPNRGTARHAVSQGINGSGLFYYIEPGYYSEGTGNAWVYRTREEVASAIGLSAGKIAEGNTILGISGTFRGASGQFLVFGGTTITNGSYEDGCAYICPSNYTDGAHTSFQNTADVTFNLKAAVTGRLFMYSLSGSWQYATFSCGGTQVGIGQTSGVGTFSGQLRIQAKPNSSTYRAVLLFGIMI